MRIILAVSTPTVRFPASLHAKLKALAQSEGISINQFLVVAAAEKMSALLTQNYLEGDARQGQRADFDRVLKAVPDMEPEAYDRL